MFCLRHAESENVLAGVAGVLPSAPLTPRGRSQAVTVAEALRREGIFGVYSSTAIRARDTADVIARITGTRTVTMPELLEVGIGTAEGATDAATRARTADVLRAWVVKRDLSARLAGGESGHEVVGRVRSALTCIASGHPGQAVAVVGHVASLTVGLKELCGLADDIWGRPLPHAAPFLVEWDGDRWRCTSWPGRRSAER
jgi:broad specificity phosphatase PhoE